MDKVPGPNVIAISCFSGEALWRPLDEVYAFSVAYLQAL